MKGPDLAQTVLNTNEMYLPQRDKRQRIRDKDRRQVMREKGGGTREKGDRKGRRKKGRRLQKVLHS